MEWHALWLFLCTDTECLVGKNGMQQILHMVIGIEALDNLYSVRITVYWLDVLFVIWAVCSIIYRKDLDKDNSD